MKHLLTLHEKQMLDRRIAEVEAETGAQIVLATVKRCDSYPEIPWKAFSIGVSITSLIVTIIFLTTPIWVTNQVLLLLTGSVLVMGLIFTGKTILYNNIARLYLSRQRKEAETQQYAEALFLSHELFATKKRKGILLLVSQFERQVVILPDVGVRDKLNPGTLDEIISKMARKLKKNELCNALKTGLDEIQAKLILSDEMKTGTNELPNEIIEEGKS